MWKLKHHKCSLGQYITYVYAALGQYIAYVYAATKLSSELRERWGDFQNASPRGL